VLFWITAFLKHSDSEVKICTVYGAIWLERQAAWVEFHSETRLGRFAAAEVFVRRFLRAGRRFQVQLFPRGAALRQLQLLRGQLQLPEGDFLFELSYERGGLLRPKLNSNKVACHPP